MELLSSKFCVVDFGCFVQINLIIGGIPLMSLLPSDLKHRDIKSCMSISAYFQVPIQEYCLMHFIYAYQCGTYYKFEVCHFLKSYDIK